MYYLKIKKKNKLRISRLNQKTHLLIQSMQTKIQFMDIINHRYFSNHMICFPWGQQFNKRAISTLTNQY